MLNSKSNLKQFKYWGNLLISYSHWLCDSCRLLFIFWLQNNFCPKCYTGFMKFCSSPFNSNGSLFVLLLIFFYFEPQFLPISVFLFLLEGLDKSFNIMTSFLPRFAYFYILMPPAHHPKCKGNNWILPPSLQYFKKEVSDEVDFLHADEH